MYLLTILSYKMMFGSKSCSQTGKKDMKKQNTHQNAFIIIRLKSKNVHYGKPIYSLLHSKLDRPNNYSHHSIHYKIIRNAN